MLFDKDAIAASQFVGQVLLLYFFDLTSVHLFWRGVADSFLDAIEEVHFTAHVVDDLVDLVEFAGFLFILRFWRRDPTNYRPLFLKCQLFLWHVLPLDQLAILHLVLYEELLK